MMKHGILIIAVVALVTALTRFLPFLVFPEGKPVPKLIDYLSRVLPCAVTGMLVVYCLKDVSITASPHGLPELIAGAAVVLSYIWKKNTLLSILGGTVIYILLINLVF